MTENIKHHKSLHLFEYNIKNEKEEKSMKLHYSQFWICFRNVEKILITWTPPVTYKFFYLNFNEMKQRRIKVVAIFNCESTIPETHKELNLFHVTFRLVFQRLEKLWF